MERINHFFETLEKLFLEKDKADFLEIKDDILREIEARAAEGESYDAILKMIGTPQEIAEAYYEDKRLDKALRAKQDVIAREDLVREYRLNRKFILKRWKLRLKNFFVFLLQICLLVLSFYLALMVIYYMVQEHVLLWGACTLFFFTVCLMLMSKKPNKLRKYMGLIYLVGTTSLACSLALFFHHAWFYQGQLIDKELWLESASLESLNFSAVYPVEVSMIQLPENENAKVEVKGHLRRTDIKNLVNATKNQTHITIGTANIFDWVQKIGKIEVVFYLPENQRHRSLNFKLEQGDVMLNHTYSDYVNLVVKQGRISITDIYSQKIQVKSHRADVIVHQFLSDMSIENTEGKTVLSDGQGKIDVSTTTGLTKVASVSSERMQLKNTEGKNVLSAGTIQQLHIRNETGTTVIERQEGNTSIKNGLGKLVLSDLTGKLSVNNDSGMMIISQQYPLNALVKSETGHVKWVQSSDIGSKFELSSQSGKINNSFKKQEKAAKKIKISTKKGNITVVQRNK
ncbi:DUF4097 family beta strand repeat-containing protein [Enterococcus ratti]|nr:DUF4097 family beta strand repeat-containing protein [Enterococcus ratti]